MLDKCLVVIYHARAHGKQASDKMLYSVRNRAITFDTVMMTVHSASGALAHTTPSHCINISTCRRTDGEAFWCCVPFVDLLNL